MKHLAQKRTVVVTGMGVVSGYGVGRDVFEKGLFSSECAIRPLSGLDTGHLKCRFGVQVPDFTGEGLVRKLELKFYDRMSLMAIAAADEALAQACLDPQEFGAQCGAMMGCAFGPTATIEESVLRVHSEQRLRPTTVLRMLLNGSTAALNTRYRLGKATAAHVTACAASGHAIADGVRAIQRGDMDLCLAGGSEAFPSRVLYCAWDAMGVMSKEDDLSKGIVRPFAEDRSGFVIGEAAAVLVLEAQERAIARGAPIFAEILGSGAVADAPNLSRPTVQGMTRAMCSALKDAGLKPEQVDYINTHGTATKLNDPFEAEAVADVFSDHKEQLVLSACKAGLGHCMGAASALEAVATIMGLRCGVAPFAVEPFTQTEPEQSWKPRSTAMKADIALSNSFAFGGDYVSLAICRR